MFVFRDETYYIFFRYANLPTDCNAFDCAGTYEFISVIPPNVQHFTNLFNSKDIRIVSKHYPHRPFASMTPDKCLSHPTCDAPKVLKLAVLLHTQVCLRPSASDKFRRRMNAEVRENSMASTVCQTEIQIELWVSLTDIHLAQTFDFRG